jgi:hypothetical protein
MQYIREGMISLISYAVSILVLFFCQRSLSKSRRELAHIRGLCEAQHEKNCQLKIKLCTIEDRLNDLSGEVLPSMARNCKTLKNDQAELLHHVNTIFVKALGIHYDWQPSSGFIRKK